ncbi:hypothetical protein BDFG_05177 [Blastomyces dermatitidis ATCC 26199]|nr:hypothetical protein BDFG_05177 [Blastomyces dermatitidis ATCC 26199]
MFSFFKFAFVCHTALAIRNGQDFFQLHFLQGNDLKRVVPYFRVPRRVSLRSLFQDYRGCYFYTVFHLSFQSSGEGRFSGGSRGGGTRPERSCAWFSTLFRGAR